MSHTSPRRNPTKSGKERVAVKWNNQALTFMKKLQIFKEVKISQNREKEETKNVEKVTKEKDCAIGTSSWY
jgi:hypothetical protein